MLTLLCATYLFIEQNKFITQKPLSHLNSSHSRNRIMNTLLLLSFHTIFIIISSLITTTLSHTSPCKKTCGPLQLKYPFGTAAGCGSPRFHPSVACSGGRLLLTTHKQTYTITSINYDTAVITVAPPCMSTCTSMQLSPSNFGLDWASPFQLGPSTFILLDCSSPTIIEKETSICDPSSTYLCAAFYSSCPAVAGLGLLPPTNTCCVYSPANLDPDNELDLEGFKCGGYTSVTALGDVPTDPARWQYGVSLKYTMGGMDGYDIAPGCRGCEMSGGVCGYAPPRDSFVCVCEYGNTTTDCTSYNWIYMSSSLRSNAKSWLGCLGVSVLVLLI